ncbi:DNA polymerase [Paenibacillus sp. J31TS4]|uniref:DNA polymerase n=1 Tax=Paenibacillus sp. J31TS4 TaxID=2807195 RepID=UPI001B00E98A|nr:DNA polymerase [Paenibacillus sp. J31TS4]GIP38327.1 DNA polymerase [Paenibacillus sp. J31TS4]
MTVLQIDLETYSSVDLIKCGVYRYVEAPDFEILLFGFAFDDDPVQVIDLTDFEELPADVVKALADDTLIKTAYNANFERTALARHFGRPMPPEAWRCSSVHALTLGLPGSLGEVAKVLGLQEQKDTAGKLLIKYFSVPCKPTKANGGRTRNLPHHAPEKWEQYKAYCRQDVETERDLRKRLAKYPVPAHEWELWTLDQRINDAGVRLEPELVRHALACDAQYTERLVAEARELTGLDNPNSVAQLIGWLQGRGLIVDGGLTKETVPILIDQAGGDEEAVRALELRQEMAKTSVKKYQAMDRAICSDNWARGLLQFCGANRTWRWAGRLIQVQNLPQNKIKDLELARELLLAGEYELLEMLFGAPPFVLSQLVRTAFIPSEGCRFIVSDFSAIEARVIAWLAGEQWRLDVFQGHGKIYEASASQMFQIPIEEITKDLRQKGKIAELALGYGGGVGALVAMGALKMGLHEEELQPLVDAWRGANRKITKLWWDVDKAAMTAVEERRTVAFHHGIRFIYEPGYLFIQLPSGRRLAYVNPQIKPGKFDKMQITYEGLDQETKRWGRISSYGPKFVENIVQAISRDCLAVSMRRLDAAGYRIRLHVHDEVVIDEPAEFDSLPEIVELMGRPIDWAPGLPLRADAFETSFYKKD